MEDDLSKPTRKEKKAAKRRRDALASATFGGAALKLPKRRADDPFRGYKQARIMYGQDRWWFRALNGIPFDVEADATCNLGVTHHAPHPHCSCGFYSYNENNRAWRYVGCYGGDLMVNLEVDLYGLVIVHKYGYRAAHQRVVNASLVVPGTCGVVTRRQLMDITTFGDASHRFVAGAPEEWCGKEATHVGGPGYTTTLCSGHAKYHDDALPIENSLDAFRRDLPTDWAIYRPPLDEPTPFF